MATKKSTKTVSKKTADKKKSQAVSSLKSKNSLKESKTTKKANGSLNGKTFLFTGTLTELTRSEGEALVKSNGGAILSGVSDKLNYLVVGEDAGSKLEKARKIKSIKVLKEKEFLKLIPVTKSKVAKTAESKKNLVSTSLLPSKEVIAGLLKEIDRQRSLEQEGLYEPHKENFISDTQIDTTSSKKANIKPMATKKSTSTIKKTSSLVSTFKTVKIGKQEWMAENLNVDKFRNGDPIPQAKTDKEWQEAGEKQQPAWCYFDNKLANGKTYGKLYNWYAVNDSRGLAPLGFHVPSDEEWESRIDYLGAGSLDEGKKMKSKKGWIKNGNGTDETGFNGLPGGYRYKSGSFYKVGDSGYWWESTELSEKLVFAIILNCLYNKVLRVSHDKSCGFSVRVLRD